MDDSTVDVDVLVIGSGVAGLSAALSAREAGAERVVVLEAERVVGGSTRLSTGIVMGAGSRAQSRAGVEDDADAYYNDYMNANEWRLPGGVVRAMTAASGETLDWIEDHGVRYHPGLVRGGSENTPRCVAVVGGGEGLVAALHRAARDAGVDIVLDQRVTRLLVRDERVCGVAVGDQVITADAVVVASGGIGASRERLEQCFPEQMAEAGSWHWYIGSDGARGDHLAFAEQVGADITGVVGLRLLHPGFAQTLESYIPGWQVLVDREGRRFVDESAPYGILDRALGAHGGRAFFVFDRQAVDEELTGTSAYRQTYPEDPDRRSPNWNPAMIAEQVEAGRIARGDTVEEVATALGIDPVALSDTVRHYNEGADRGVDRWGKGPAYLRPLLHPPFHGAEVRLATLCWTGTGLRIDDRARVLDGRGDVVPGLWAAGESSGGPMGEVYVGSGGSIANGAIFGRIAGREAARARPR
ncbi:fumarate reductase flavoprotein subunit [Nocardioides cavernae]|uniref:Fumarate reductase flavoprotein subunit n=1 Tax=Nocardioides cavernae TaxID=1921566 RepID=A0A7Y9KNK7_9ACTN|nr:FAD-dependent oxidoreductase [Nocardioides cavernae]NYE35816.1 fumarate reductase flavoprotein subunit [Nocardioides cavernae]